MVDRIREPCRDVKDTHRLMWPGRKARCQKPKGHDGWHYAKHVTGKHLSWGVQVVEALKVEP